MKTQRFILAGVLALFATAAVAQSTMGSADVPFAFTVGATAMPAGHYRVDTLSNGALAISGSKTILCLATYTQANKVLEEGKLVFHRYGNRYFLSQIWQGGDIRGRQLPESSLERELALNGQSQQVLVALVMPHPRMSR